ncbi:hypothetical protein HG536_0G00310 [Torulaspora globosa]|uniref:Nucleolar pre-ribosomal-associated protein 1 C-terminal domain-containing protein n=1 Tax=Torulaspora globosa TaxID=48254 RepID=A0A7G3ZKY8_9SACH|nr:uncharacterized protein HG536_0G00310 [Torulaspora globosa]QLL34174.1 hypothetical protein HG536_0G00310 [Torulaspora globosa]
MDRDRQSKLNHAAEKKYAKSSNVNDGVLDNLSNIISTLVDEGDCKDFRPLIVFSQKGFLSQVVQVWSYYAQVNNHPKFSKATTLLETVLRQLNSDPNIQEYGSSLILLILTGNIKVLYRGVNTMRPSIANPILRLMRQMISFNNGQHVEAFVANFDLSLPGLVRILAASKTDAAIVREDSSRSPKSTIRDTFLNFWLELISQSSPLLRKQVISTNSKIMGAWFKVMDKIDTSEMIGHTLDVFTNLILRESSYKRTTKCQILNELAVSKIHTFYYSADRNLVQKVNDFFLAYGSNPESSVTFPDDAVWFKNSPISGTHRGAEISIHQRDFKIYNKLLFNVLKIFKPWEDDTQLNTVIKILDNVPELVAPYAAFLASLGAHDPKMTSYWFGCTALLGRIMRLRIPSLVEKVETDMPPHTPLVLESIMPSSLSKSALTKSLQHERLIIRQLACQLLIFAFQKLQSVLDLYDRKGWTSAKASVRNAFYLSLPDLSILSSAMNQSYESHKKNKILQLSISTILRHYSTIFPNFFTVRLPSANIFFDIMQSNNISGMDLAILENFLTFQELNGLQTKWWTRSNRELSLFTSLLKVARGSSNSLAERLCQLLDDMFRGTVAFNSKLLCSPHRALIHSIQSIPSISETEILKIWRIIDESIQHVMRVPYKYVDMSANYDCLSPFILALLEQCKYANTDKNFDISQKWVSFYLRTMIICGESEEGIVNAANCYLSDACQEYIKRYLGDSSAIEESAEEEQFRDSIIQNSFCDLVILEKYPHLKKITRYPVSKLDAAGLLFRIRKLAKDLAVEYDGYFKSTSRALISMLADYADADRSFTFLSSSVLMSFLRLITEPSSSEAMKLKNRYVIRLMLQACQEVRSNYSELKSTIYDWLQSKDEMLQETYSNEENVLFMSAALSFLGSDDCAKILLHKKQLSFISTQLLAKVILESNNSCIPFSIIMLLVKEASPESHRIASQFIAQKRVKDLRAGELLQEILSDDLYSGVTQAFISSDYFSADQISACLQSVRGEQNTLLVALALHQFRQEEIREYVTKVLRSSRSLIGSDNSSVSQLALELVYQCPDSFSANEKKQLVEYVTNEYKDKYCAAVVKCVVTMSDFEEKDVVKWLNKLVLYITKCFSTAAMVDSQLLGTLDELKKLKDTVWQSVNKNILNSHQEVILSGSLVNQEKVLEYALRVLLAVGPGSTWNERLMQCLVNNESKKLTNNENENYVPFLTASILYILYLGDRERNSNAAIQEALLSCYEGTISAKDRLILKTLELIEAQTSHSWTNLIYDWELIDDTEEDVNQGYVELIAKRKEGLIITLKRQTIAKSATNYKFDRPRVPSLEGSKSNLSWKVMVSFYQSVEKDKPTSSFYDLYDPLFLLLLSGQNEELVKSSKSESGGLEYKFDVKAFLTSNIFQVVICSLGDETEVQSIALTLIEGMLSTLQKDDYLKDMRIFKILLSKIVYTFMKSKTAGNEYTNSIAPCVWFAISQLATELAQPTSQLHDKAVRWVLSRPLVRPIDLPLYQELFHSKEIGNTDQNIYYKQLGWVLNILQLGLKTEQDVELMKRIGVLEWLSNLLSMPYINGRMRSAVSAIFYACQRLGNSGSSLVTRAASIATFELQKVSLERKVNSAELEVMKNPKNSRHLQKFLSLQQQNLNCLEILSSHAILAGSNKRLREWTENDAYNIEKRVKLPKG